MKRTKQQLVVAWIEQSGYKEQSDFNTKRYRVFLNVGKPGFAFVGKHGALRFGQTISKSTSYHIDFSKLRVVMASKIA